MTNVDKAADAKKLLVSLGVNVIQGSRWKMRWLVEWDEPTKWKLPIATCSPSMEQLREKFGSLEIWAAM